MADTSTDEQPKGTLSVFTCINPRHPSRSCYALIENTTDVRQKHRQWHIDQETDREALRGAIKARDEEIARYREELSGYRRDVAAMDQTVQDFHGEVQRVETPIIPPQLQIDRNGYSDDELDDEPDEPGPLTSLIDDADLPITDEFLASIPPQPTATEEAADDDDDLPVPMTTRTW